VVEGLMTRAAMRNARLYYLISRSLGSAVAVIRESEIGGASLDAIQTDHARCVMCAIESRTEARWSTIGFPRIRYRRAQAVDASIAFARQTVNNWIRLTTST